MLNAVCLEVRNFFDRNQPKIFGDIVISDGAITNADFLSDIQGNQYFRIVGSVFNDGVYQYTDELELTDEVFNGAIWLMRVPRDFLALVAEIEDWQAKYGGVGTEAMSPFNSESFGGYSYSKSGGNTAGGSSSGGASWQAAYGTRLKAYRRARII